MPRATAVVFPSLWRCSARAPLPLGHLLSTSAVCVRRISHSVESAVPVAPKDPRARVGPSPSAARLSQMEALFKLIHCHIATAPCATRVSTLYARLPFMLEEVLTCETGDTRRWLRSHFGTLVSALRRLHESNATNHWGVYVSSCAVYTVLARDAAEADEAFSHAAMEESLLECFMPEFPHFAPPAPLVRGSVKREAPAGAFTAQMLVPYVPTYFIPLNELVATLPGGYTAAHVENIFAATGALETVTLEGETFVRLHGGKRLVDFAADGPAAHERWRAFMPDPFLCVPFRRHLPPSPRWASLRAVVESAAPALRDALRPWRDYKTLLFFAQMQHVFGFSPSGEGEVAWLAPVNWLSFHNSPTPAVVSELVGVLEGHRICLADLQDPAGTRISPFAKTQILLYYGTLRAFFKVHGEVFYTEDTQDIKNNGDKDDDKDEEGRRTIIGLVANRNSANNTTRSLEEKLEAALTQRNRRTAQKIRRRIAIENNPDNPFADRVVLLDAIMRYVPPRRSISLNFLLKSLPPGLSEFLPDKPISLFKNAPDKVRLFEYRYRHRIHLIRPGVPLPQGILRDHYTEEELLFLCAAELREHPRISCDLYGRLPYGAKEVIRQQYKSLLELFKPYPQYFTIVFKDSLRMDTRTALVTLISQPPAVQLSNEECGIIDPMGEEEQKLLDEEDMEALRTLPDELQETIRVSQKSK